MLRFFRLRLPALLAFLFLTTTVAAQTFQGRHHMLDSAELKVSTNDFKAFTATAPPTGIVRPVAEWEPAQAVIVVYPTGVGFGIPLNLVASMSQHTPVITLVESSSAQSTVTSQYNSNGVNLANCSFLTTAVDSYWARDFSPWFIMVNNSEVAVIDFPYNRPSRPNDDNVPVVMATHLGMDLYGMDVTHTGGNFMNDGINTAAMTDLVLDEDSQTEAQIDTLFKRFMGITHNYITTDPLGDYIKHIDCWGKFLDVDKVLIGKVATSNPQYSDYEAMATWWGTQVSAYGNNYQVYRVYEPNGQPYTNSLILNNYVYVPTMGGSSATYDANAIAVYQAAMPGYTIVPILTNSSTPWESTDALHCRTHEVADKNMLYVQHQPLLGSQNQSSQYTINANIYALSGSNLISDSVYLRYKVNTGAWQKVLMSHTSGNSWTGAIPQQQANDTIRYYIHASDLSPKSVTHPLIGSPDPHKFYISSIVGGLNDQAISTLLVFPNPATDVLFVQVKDPTVTHIDLSIMNAMGACVAEQHVDQPVSALIRFDLLDLPTGTYFLKTLTNQVTETKPFVIMH